MTAENIATRLKEAAATAAATGRRLQLWRPFSDHFLLLLLLLVAACGCSSIPSASAIFVQPNKIRDFAFAEEPPATFLVSSPTAATLACRLPLSPDPRLRLRWRYEEIDWASGAGAVESANASRYVDASTARAKTPFYDAGNGELVFPAGSNDAQFVLSGPGRFQGLPKYKLYCEARNSNTVMLSRMVLPKKMSTLRTIKPVLNCFSGPLNGSAVCRLHTDPSLHRLSEYFNVEYFREPLSLCGSGGGGGSSSQERLEFGQISGTKYATFNAEQGLLHVMSLTHEDAQFCYRARISLLDPAGREVYWNMSEPRRLRIIDPASIVSGDASRTEAAFVYWESRRIVLPCYAGGASLGSGYKWRLNGGQPLDVGSPEESPAGRRKYSYLDGNSGSLLMRLDGRNDSGQYECSRNDHTVLTARLHFFKPLAVRLPVRQLSADHGASLSLNCTVTGWPLSRILWLRNGARLPDGDPRCRVETDIDAEGEGPSIGRLTISGIGLSDQGAYQCVAERDPDSGRRLVPYDSAQDALFLTVNKAPPQLIGQSPELPLVPVFLNGSDTVGHFSCRFRALAEPPLHFRTRLDGSAGLFDELVSHGVFQFRRDQLESGDILVSVDLNPSRLEHTGRLTVEARNDYGVATCRMTIFAAVHPPVLSVRPFEPRQLAVTQQPFSLHCNVLGGLNSKAAPALARLRLAYPDLRVPTYSLDWQLLQNPNQPLVLPRDHRMQTDDPEWPDRLHVTSMEPSDAGKYTCRAKLTGDSGSVYAVSTLDPMASTDVAVVYGISVSKLQDQLNLDTGLAIADTCKPINSPTGDWIAWWTFRQLGSNGGDTPLPPGAVTYPSASHSSSTEFYDSYHSDLSDSCRAKQSDLLAEAGQSHAYGPWNKSANLQLHLLTMSEHERERFQGVYTCHIASCFDRKSAVKRVTLKRVYKFLKDKPPNNKEVVLGSPLTVQCAVDNPGQPPPELSWYQGNRPDSNFEIPMFQSGRTQRISQFPNGTLSISEVSISDKNFLCSVNRGRSATLNLNINRPALHHRVVRPSWPGHCPRDPISGCVCIAYCTRTASCVYSLSKHLAEVLLGCSMLK